MPKRTGSPQPCREWASPSVLGATHPVRPCQPWQFASPRKTPYAIQGPTFVDLPYGRTVSGGPRQTSSRGASDRRGPARPGGAWTPRKAHQPIATQIVVEPSLDARPHTCMWCLMWRRVSSEIGDLRRLTPPRFSEASDRQDKSRAIFTRAAIGVTLASLGLTCAVAPWVLALRRTPSEPDAIAAQAPAANDRPQSLTPIVPALGTSEGPAPSATVRSLEPPVAEPLPPSADLSRVLAPPRAMTRSPESVGGAVTIDSALHVAAPDTTPTSDAGAVAHGEELLLVVATLVPPSTAPTLGPGRAQQAWSPIITRSVRLPPLPPARDPLRPSRRSHEPPAADQTASVTALPKPPRGRIDTGMIVRTFTHRVQPRSNGARASSTSPVPWRLPSVIAPTD
ncbi:hypothetical protein HPGCJGGD_0178 [Methylobacterium haplocladii]|nr:hypothetical protein HPGCJGGD_0178 [Methylobacterium haplocladii]